MSLVPNAGPSPYVPAMKIGQLAALSTETGTLGLFDPSGVFNGQHGVRLAGSAGALLITDLDIATAQQPATISLLPVSNQSANDAGNTKVTGQYRYGPTDLRTNVAYLNPVQLVNGASFSATPATVTTSNGTFPAGNLLTATSGVTTNFLIQPAFVTTTAAAQVAGTFRVDMTYIILGTQATTTAAAGAGVYEQFIIAVGIPVVPGTPDTAYLQHFVVDQIDMPIAFTFPAGYQRQLTLSGTFTPAATTNAGLPPIQIFASVHSNGAVGTASYGLQITSFNITKVGGTQ